MNSTELSKHNGQNGNQAYVAVNGKVYDVTNSSHWQNGDHEGVHQAGNDLTEELKAAPHVRSVIERFPVIDNLEQNKVQKKSNNAVTISISIVAVIILVVVFLLTK